MSWDAIRLHNTIQVLHLRRFRLLIHVDTWLDLFPRRHVNLFSNSNRADPRLYSGDTIDLCS